MRERDLIVGVLAARAGFATPSEVLNAAAAGLIDSVPESLLTRLERTGTLSVQRRKILEATGERLAWFQVLSHLVTPVRVEQYHPDLQMKAVAGETTWDMRAVPQPDQRPAAESLAQTLQRTGLELRGAELVAAP